MGPNQGNPGTDIHVLVDTLDDPPTMIVTAGQVHDLAGAGTLLHKMGVQALPVDKTYGAGKRVTESLKAAEKTTRNFLATFYIVSVVFA